MIPLPRVLVAVAVGVLSLPALMTRPPATAQEAAWRQLGFRASGPRAPWRPGAVVAIVRYVRIPAGRKTVADKSLDKGQRRLLAQGSDGLRVERAPAKIGQDGTVRRLRPTSRLRRRPHPATLAVGTLPVHYLMRAGVTYRYTQRLRLVATAYNASYAQNGPWGATAALNGMPLQRGMVAVDPSVIPLGTRLYVDGYGPALAADTGSAIVGDRIDLYYDRSALETASFGIRTLNVYVLGPATS